jgi:hypothetical protein
VSPGGRERAGRRDDFPRAAEAVSAGAQAFAGALVAGASPFSWPAVASAFAAAALWCGAYLFLQQFHARLPGTVGGAESDPGSPGFAATWRRAWAALLIGLAFTLAGGPAALAVGLVLAVLLAARASAGERALGPDCLLYAAARAATFGLGLALAAARPVPLAGILAPAVLFGAGWELLRHSRRPGLPPTTGFMALLHLAAGLALMVYLVAGVLPQRQEALPFLICWIALTLPRLVHAVFEPRRPIVIAALQYGLIGFTLVDACLASGFSPWGWGSGLAVCLAGLPVPYLLRRRPVLLVDES